MSADKTRRLGRGLEALLAVTQPQEGAGRPESQVAQIPLTRIRPNPYQPRIEFKPEELADLEASIKASGLLQPVTVRRAADGYELIAGERRLRAVTRLGWAEVPAIVRDVDDRTLLTLALVENLQRANLNPIEEAEGYRRLQDEFGLTQQQVADAVGKDRTTITNCLRILTLPEPVLELLRGGQLTAGHARALLVLPDAERRETLAREAVAKQLSVRDVEHRARLSADEKAAPVGDRSVANEEAPRPIAERTRALEVPIEVRRIEDRLRRRLQTDVSISVSGGERGTVRIAFYSADDLERIMDLMLGSDRSDFD